MESLPPSGNVDEETVATADSAGRRPDSAPLARGCCIGRYVVIDKIGHGGMGVVYAAYDPELDRRVALKLLVPGADGQTLAGGEVGNRLQREAQAMAKLAHAHVVAVHDVGTFEGAVFIAMEFVDGGTLGARMARRPAWRELLPLFVQAGRGLAAAHAAGLVHRDFKPDNVLLTRDGIAKVSDFGLARAVEPATQTDATIGPPAVVGTPAYMAPEQHLHVAVDARSDQFSFCVALYEALYGERPFPARSLVELVHAVTQGTIASPPRDAVVPTWLRQVVVRGLAVSPDDRWPTMDALLSALLADPTQRKRRRRWLGLAGVVAVASVAAVAVLDRRERDACRAEGAVIHALWSADARERVAAALRATEVPYAEATIMRVESLLDPWTARWAAMREDVCLAAARAASTEIAALQRSCLDARLVHLEVGLELLGEADAEIAAGAAQQIAALPRLDPCADTAWLQRVAARVGTSTPALEVAVARLAALTSAHRSERAHTLADELLATTKDDPRLHAEVLHLRGRLAERDGDLVTARRHMRAAYYLAGSHHGDRTAALAATGLTMIVGVQMHELVEGRTWADDATMMFERDPDPELRIELLYALGALELAAGNNDHAFTQFLEQVSLATVLYGADHPEAAHAHLALGNAYNTAGYYADAHGEYERARGIWERTLGPEHPTVAAVVYNVGNLLFKEGRYADALAQHREVLALRERGLPAGHYDTAMSHGAIGNILGTLGDHEGALASHRRALAIFEALYGRDHPRVVPELHNVGRDLIELRRLDEAEHIIDRQCAGAERARGQDPVAALQCIGQRGDLLFARERPAEAARKFEEALRAAELTYGTTDPTTATWQFLWARALLASGDATRAKSELEHVLASWSLSRSESHPEIRDALELLGRAQLALGETKAAVHSSERALALADGNDAAADERSARRMSLAAAMWAAGDRTGARALALEAREILAAVPDRPAGRLAVITRWLDDHPAPKLR